MIDPVSPIAASSAMRAAPPSVCPPACSHSSPLNASDSRAARASEREESESAVIGAANQDGRPL
ncbi:hypothetical protein DP43_5569 [Burkholderia pseudomallei]|nr:hypothetical protein DP43_5569 [Burkholderia pseudomallei]